MASVADALEITSMSLSCIASDWAPPRNALAFTGYAGNPARDGPGGPSGTLLLCVNNTPIPCKEGDPQKSVQFTVINVRKKGWSYAPWFSSFFFAQPALPFLQ